MQAGNTFYTSSQLAGMQDIDQRLTRDIGGWHSNSSVLLGGLFALADLPVQQDNCCCEPAPPGW